uniref:Ycf54 n=1 Tax=Callithamnion tetricum TaxID=193179 RepID=A0A4D6WMB5_9FLOR|nr:hypothetical protein [Callithamnion tetricum]
MAYNYYFAIATQNFFLNEEPIEEILRERQSYYKSLNKEIDFWFTLNNDMIHSYCGQSVNLIKTQEYGAIISFDEDFIQWFKLRVSFVAIGYFESNSILCLT